jgi:hypothetical protein
LVVEVVVKERIQWATVVVNNRLVDNLLPTIVGRWFWSHRHMRRDSDTREILMCLEGRSFGSGLEDFMAN